MAIIVHTCAKTNQSTQFQDETYGKGRRVANPVDKSRVNGVVQRWKCCSCGESVGKELLAPSRAA